ncbi:MULTISPECIES: hypothetical protein [Pseudomonas]|jgi:hypothetical protein|uniref:Uncharacterized protein n=2 Tax=Pseudomonas TaxID=286 RepID=A0ABR6TCV9_9PSED|nr:MULTISPECIES: hypothetical protein [Pseudomonas]MBC2383793.1 hypothetical protein [Pseudomonas cremoris]
MGGHVSAITHRPKLENMITCLGDLEGSLLAQLGVPISSDLELGVDVTNEKGRPLAALNQMNVNLAPQTPS